MNYLGLLTEAEHAFRPARSRRAIRLGIYAALALGDCVAIALAFLFGSLIRFGEPFDPSAVVSFVVMLAVYLGIAVQRKPYSGRFFANWRRTARDSITALVTALAVAGFVAVYLHAAVHISRSVVLISGGFAAILLVGQRWMLRRLAMRLLGGHPVATLVIADGAAARATAAELDARVIDAAAHGLIPDRGDPAAFARLHRAVGGAERLIVICPDPAREAWAAMLQGSNVQGEIVMPELAAVGAVRASFLDGRATAVVSVGPLDTTGRVVKRVFDLGVATTALLLLWPLLLLVAIAIRLDSPGPVLFRQPRVGRANALFQILKFRSMRDDLSDHAGDRSTARGDPRVTRVGRFIRKTSIDELPQLFNVLAGSMSIVGPRPHALGSLAGDKLFWEVDDRYWDRHAMKPGITGLAQVHGHRGATAKQADLTNRLQSDIAYMRNWSIWRDLRILVATVGVLLHRNAF